VWQGAAGGLLAALATLLLPAPSAVRAQPLAPSAPAAPPAPHTPAPMPRCGEDWVQQVYATRRPSVAQIETSTGLGAGFVFHTDRHLATAFHVIDLGRPVTALLSDGRRLPAQVVAVDPRHDLAILELPVGTGLPVLVPAAGEPRVGDAVMAVGHPYARRRFEPRLQGLLAWSATQGIISARTRWLLQTDAAVNPGNSGGPLFDCQGHLLGVVSAKLRGEGIGFVVPAAQLTALATQIGLQPRYRGKVSFELEAALGFGLRPGSTFIGPVIGTHMVLRDRWTFGVRGDFLFGIVSGDDRPVQGQTLTVDESRTRLNAELDLGYRIQVGAGYLIPSLGGFVGSEDHRRSTLSLVPAMAGCQNGDPGCVLALRKATATQHAVVGGPQFGLQLRFGNALVDYAYQLDARATTTSVHRLLLGFRL
jgi:hypothetical protein